MPEQPRGAETAEAVKTVSGPPGEVLAGISSGMVRLYREHFGKGPTKAKTYALDDLVICVMRDGLSPAERTLYQSGKASTVREMRSAYLDAVAESFNSVVERLTGRVVKAFMSQTNAGPDLMITVFFLDGPVDRDGTLETDGGGNQV